MEISTATSKNTTHGYKSHSEIPVTEKRVDGYPMSSAQSSLWILSQSDEGSRAYNIPTLYEFRGNLDRTGFGYAVKIILGRHEILRTVFKAGQDEEVKQFINEESEDINIITYYDFRLASNQIDFKERIQSDFSWKFDLSKLPLFRIGLYQLKDNEWIFSFVMHHIIVDGLSLDILIRELLHFYTMYQKGIKDFSRPLRIQFKDYAVWQQEMLCGQDWNVHRDYWLHQLSGEIPLLDLQTDYIRPNVKTYNGASVRKTIKSSTANEIKNLFKEQGATLFMGLLASVYVLLYKYSSQNDIIMGSPISGRNNEDLDEQIGLFVNMLVLRIQLKEDETFLELIQKVKLLTLDAYEHQEYPFCELVNQLKIGRDASRNPLFDVGIVFKNSETEISRNTNISEEIKLSIREEESKYAKFDLLFDFIAIDEAIHLRLEYNTDIYKKSSITQLANHFEQILAAIIKEPLMPIKGICYLSDEEKQLLIESFNKRKIDYPRNKTITDLFEEQVAKNPSNTALAFKDLNLSYNELNERSNQFGNYLKEKYTLQTNDLIGLHLERSEWVVIAMLAILKVGCAYVPIDYGCPQNRVDYILSDSSCEVVINELELQQFRQVCEKFSSNNLKRLSNSNDLAYVIYTSGTTGLPKGVLVEHRNVVRLFRNSKPLFNFGEDDVWTMFHSCSFDFSVWEIYGALLNGGKLIIVPFKIVKDPLNFLNFIYRHGVTVLNQTPSSFYSLIDQEIDKCDSKFQLKYLIFGGEALSPGKLLGWKTKHPNVCLINMYGITETTVHSTYLEVTEKEIGDNSKSIGKPLPTVSCYVLDQNRNLVPVGVAGELYIGGEGVCRGYLNRDELTNQRFLANPFLVGERLYRSGDRVKLLEEGELAYLGRLDEQVKIRGHRIELGEIENVLRGMANILDAAVIVKSGINGDGDLIAYVIGKEKLSSIKLRFELSLQLPEVMVPSHFIQLDRLPLTANGKINKKELPRSEGFKFLNNTTYVTPRNEVEKILASIWQDILDIKSVSIYDDFFDLGGHSLILVKMQSEIRKQFFVSISFSVLFENTTIESLSQYIRFFQARNKSDLGKKTLNL